MKKLNRMIMFFTVIAVSFFSFGACVSASSGSFAVREDIPAGKALVYVFHGGDFGTSIGGQNLTVFLRSMDPQKKYNTFSKMKPGFWLVKENYSAILEVDPANPDDVQVVFHTLFPRYNGGGDQFQLTYTFDGMEAGKNYYLKTSIKNGFKKEIIIKQLTEDEALPLMKGEKGDGKMGLRY